MQKRAPLQTVRLQEMKARLAHIAGSDHGRKWYAAELVKACKLRMLKPQRQTNLTYAEEKARCQITWQQLDCRIWDVAFGSEHALKNESRGGRECLHVEQRRLCVRFQ